MCIFLLFKIFRLFFINIFLISSVRFLSTASGLTIDKAAALAGGYTQRASKTEVEVIREIGGVAQAIEVNATQFIYPGDSIKVKKTFF